MNRENLYYKTVDILLDAYNEGNLLSGNCYACAVGNIIAANMGIKMLKSSDNNDLPIVYWEGHLPYSAPGCTKDIKKRWIAVFGHRMVHKDGLNKENIKEIKSTGYSLKELSFIEDAFERPLMYGMKNYHLESRLRSVLLSLEEIHSTEKGLENKLQKTLDLKTKIYEKGNESNKTGHSECTDSCINEYI